VGMLSFLKKMVPILVAALLLNACGGPDEENYKSTVPLTPPPLQERVAVNPSNSEVEKDELPEMTEIPLPNQVNLDVPFYSQAPEGDWSLPWQEACEESSLLLAHAYATGQGI